MTNNVIVFRKPLAERAPSMATPLPPAWASRHLDAFFDVGNWRVSARGNLYIRIDAFCITTFPRPGGWKWSRARSAIEGPVYSHQIYDSESDARRGAWEALVELIRAEGEGR